MRKSLLKNTIETLFVLLMLAALYSIPFISFQNESPKTDPGISRYFEPAMVIETSESFSQASFLDQCYVTILHVMLLFFGNSMIAAELFQITLWAITIVPVYVSIRRIADREIALLCLAVFTCISFIRRDLHFLRPIALIIFVFALVLTILIRILKRPSSRLSEENPEMATAEPIQALPQNPHQIPNVLPGPRKHIRKEAIDYSYPVAPELLYFDIETTEADDFDLQ